jgi:IclR family mhp operon transcriptional activator
MTDSPALLPEKTLALLSIIGGEGSMNVSRLAALTGISRPAVYRILDSLIALGIVRRRYSDGLYCLSAGAGILGRGFSDDHGLRGIGEAAIMRIQQRLIWPVDLAGLFEDGLYLIASTRQDSPLALGAVTTPGSPISLLDSALGLAFLAGAPGDLLARMAGPRIPAAARRALAIADERGHVLRTEGRVGMIAVAISGQNHPRGAIGLEYFTAAMSEEDAVKACLPMLLQEATEIARQLDLRREPSRRSPRRHGSPG